MSVASFHWDIAPTEKQAKTPSLASRLTWGTFALEALPNTLTDEAAEHEEAVDNSSSKDGDARDHSYGFAVAEKLVKRAASVASTMDKFDWDALPPQGR